MKIVSPMMTPTLKKLAAVVAARTGARRMLSGMNGSGARATRHTNNSHSTTAPASKPKIGADTQP